MTSLNVKWEPADGAVRQYKIFYVPATGGIEDTVWLAETHSALGFVCFSAYLCLILRVSSWVKKTTTTKKQYTPDVWAKEPDKEPNS